MVGEKEREEMKKERKTKKKITKARKKKVKKKTVRNVLHIDTTNFGFNYAKHFTNLYNSLKHIPLSLYKYGYTYMYVRS